MCKDQNLIDTYKQNKDLYATIGSFIFHKTYWECMEHWENGDPNPEGATIRKKCKQIVLGITYGMGAKLMASNLGVSIEECKEILDEFYKMFPTVKEFTLNNEKMAKEKGYVEDYIGRQRHLPDANLEPLEIRAKKTIITDADVFIDCSLEDSSISIPDEEKNTIWKHKWEDYQRSHKGNFYDIKKDFKELAKNNGIDTFDNGAFISKTMTQCTNARIQGGAASLTKLAMVNIFKDERLRAMGAYLIITVHDEVLVECPEKYADEVEKILPEIMVNTAKQAGINVPMKCDPYNVTRWYCDEYAVAIQEEYKKLEKSGLSKDEALNSLYSAHSELPQAAIIKTIETGCDLDF